MDLASASLAAIAEKNPAHNGYITIDQDKTLAEARAADERIGQGNTAALTGVPVAYKDVFCQTGWRCACASKMLENFISHYTAT
ncbi:amidase family protein, partial [Neisseria meningitidis]|uniref:amidase family protein n=1 Tax=Neisseria meningitidis TaxID=487 RepID=UPI0021BE0B31